TGFQTPPLPSLLTTELVLLALPAQAKADVLEALAAHVARAHPHVDARRLADAVHDRERQAASALRDSVANTHARLPRRARREPRRHPVRCGGRAAHPALPAPRRRRRAARQPSEAAGDGSALAQ